MLKTAAGKCCIAFLFAVPLYLTWHQVWLTAPLFVLLFSFFEKQRLRLVFAVSAIYWFFFDSLFNFKSYSFRQDIGPDSETDIFLRILKKTPEVHMPSAMMTAFGIAALFLIIATYKKAFHKLPIILYLMIIVVLFVFLLNFAQPPALSYVLGIGTFVIFLKCFWYLAFALSDVKSGSLVGPSSYLSAVAPFWTYGFVRINAIPRGFSELTSIEAKSSDELVDIQKSGLKLAYSAMLCKLFAAALFNIFYALPFTLPLVGAVELPQLGFLLPNQIGLSQYNLAPISQIEKWITLILRPVLYFLYELAGNAGLLVAFLRLLGFNAKNATHKPYLASNFNDFFSRVYFYYNSLLVQFFFFPLYEFGLRLKLPSRLRIFACAFLTVILGGLVMTYVRGNLYIVGLGPMGAFKLALGRISYFLTLGVAAGISAAYARGTKFDPTKNTFHPIRFGRIFLVYAFAFSLQGDLLHDSLMDRVHWALSLFGL